MLNYASPQPVDRFGNQVRTEQSSPNPAIATNVSGALVSSIIALDNRATVLEVTTGTEGGAAIKWFGSVIGAVGASYPSITIATADNFVGPSVTRRFVIPVSVIGKSNAGSVVGGYGAQNGLYTQVAVMPTGAGAKATSIFTSQFV